jgi:hypothetical protein
MNLHFEQARLNTRRHFLKHCQVGLGAMALSSLLDRPSVGQTAGDSDNPLAVRAAQFAPRAKSVIYLHMSGSPPQQELSTGSPSWSSTHADLSG